MSSSSKVRYAVIGVGNIAQAAVLPAFKHVKNSQLVSLISGDPEKRAELSQKYDLDPALVGDYPQLERLLDVGEIDAVYIATPNALHKEFTLRAAARGKHVLCEKPLATSVTDCESMSDACKRARAKLMVAYRLHFEAASLEALELVHFGKIGAPRIFSSVFGHTVRAGNIRDQPEMGGGAMFDLGVYCVNAARNLFRAEPVLVFATSQSKNGVDDTTTVMLRFSDERMAQFTVSNSIASISSYRVSGSAGDLRVEPAFEYADKTVHHLTIDGKTSSETFSKRDQFAPEIEYFSKCILEDLEPEPNAEEGIADVRIIEAVLESAATGKAVPLSPFQRARRPDMSQEQKRPAVSKQETVNAPSPSVK